MDYDDDDDDGGYASYNVELSLMRLYTEMCDRSLIRTYDRLGKLVAMSEDTLVYGTPCGLIVNDIIKCAYMEGGRARLLMVVVFLFGVVVLKNNRIYNFLSVKEFAT